MATYTNPQQNQSLANGDIINYTATESSKSLILPPGEYQIECWGARGGDMFRDSSSNVWTGKGGYGGYTKGTLKISTKTLIYVYVGSRGKGYYEPGWISNHLGGWNGGGNCGNLGSSGGGGASDIRLLGGNWNDISSLRSRIMVAAGGGGSNDWANGGAGGGLTGGNGADSENKYIATGGTQTAGGTGNCKNGGFGTGGGFDTVNNDGGGGGSGYYGGGQPTSNRASGAGGSSFISGHPGCNAINSSGVHTNQSNHYSGYIFINTTMTAGVCNDNGSIKITVIKIDPPVQILCKSPNGVWGWRSENYDFSGYSKLSKNDNGDVITEPAVSYDIDFDPNNIGISIPITLHPGKYKIELWGAAGEGANPTANVGSRRGRGGYVSGIIDIERTLTLYAFIGGSGGIQSSSSGSQNIQILLGGFNGGGDTSRNTGNGATGGPGGGATDIRLINGVWNNVQSLRSRIMVAGGGGGSDDWDGKGINITGTGSGGSKGGSNDGSGGDGGGLSGTAGILDGVLQPTRIPPGTQTTGYAFGFGGPYRVVNDCGGGGGGYYGGYGSDHNNAGGAGGSSFISGHPGCNAIDVNGNHTNQPIHYSGLHFTDTVMTPGVRDGNGSIKITLLATYLFGTYLVRNNGKIGWRYIPPIVTVTWDPGGGQ